MLLKIIVVLFSFSSALGYLIQDTPEDLKEFFENIDTQVYGLERETMIQIRTNEVPLGMYVDNAKNAIIDNLTSAAEPYWAKIKSLEESAAQQGQNISSCISLGYNQLYALNYTVGTKAQAKCNYYRSSGNNILTSSSTSAYSVIIELIALGEVVDACNDDICATDLKKIATQYYARAKSTLIDAETKSRNYVLVYLPVLLAEHGLDVNSYVANYTVFLNDVTDCINKL